MGCSYEERVSNGRNKVNQLHSIISDRNIFECPKTLLLSVLRPSIRYGSEVWKCIRINSLGGPELKRFLDAHLGLVMRQLEGTWV